jgi:Condensation domain
MEDVINSRPLASGLVSFQSWSRLHSQRDVCQQPRVEPIDWNYWSMTEMSNLQRDVVEEGFSLDTNATRLIPGKCNDAVRTEPVDILLAAIAHAFTQVFSDRQAPAIYVEGHGRDAEPDVDVSGTVGWFTTISKFQTSTTSKHSDLLLMLRQAKDYRQQLKQHKEDFLSSMFSDSGALWASDPTMEILFNYEGQYQQFERPESLFNLSTVPTADIGNYIRRWALFDISAVVKCGQIHFTFTYSHKAAHQDKIKSWI